jgi:uncharacterized membrane protein
MYYRDSDTQHWFLIFYHNPDEPKLWVTRRSGLPWTLNFARPLAWVITCGIAALVMFAASANN